MYVYKLIHRRKIDGNNAYNSKLIGIYSSKQIVQQTIEKYYKIEGFKDYPNCFEIETYKLDIDNENTRLITYKEG